MKKLTPLVIVFISLVSINNLFGQSQNKELLDPIPFDAQIRYGKLANGFTYYIRKNDQPENEIVLRMVVKAGLLHEDKDQLQLSHLLEHMGFRGLEHFPEGIRSYFEKEGISRNNLGASTGKLRTKYELKIPGGKEELFKNSLLILKDWAHGFLLNPDEIDIERNVVIAEIRRSGEEGRRITEYNSRLLRHPKYPPDESQAWIKNLERFKHKSFFRFYDNWYRPDRQAAIIVGNINVDDVEEQVKRLFSDIKFPAKSLKEKNLLNDYKVNLDGRNSFIKITKELSSHIEFKTLIKVSGQNQFGKKLEVNDYRLGIIDRLCNEMSEARFKAFSEKSMSANLSSVIVRAAIRNEAQIDALQTVIRINNSQPIKTEFQSAITELERIKRYGFSNEELIQAKKIVKVSYGQKKTVGSETLAERYVDHFVFNAAAPAPEYERELNNNLIEEISLEEVNLLIQEWLSMTKNIDIVVSASAENLMMLDENTVNNWIREVKKLNIDSFPARAVHTNSITGLIPGNKIPQLNQELIAGETTIGSVGVKELKLINGSRIILKSVNPTGGQGDKILLQAFSPGGSSLYSGDDYFNACVASSIINASGVGGFDQNEIKEYLADKGVKVYSSITEDEERIIGSSTRENFEAMIQLVYLYFTAPNKNEKAFNLWISQQEYLKNDSIQNVLKDGSVNTNDRDDKQLSYGSLKKIKLDRVYQIFQERFSDASDFTFVITGNFNIQECEPVILKYLGTLRATNRREHPGELLTPTLTSARMTKTIKMNSETSASIQLHFSGKYNFNDTANLKIDLLNEILRSKLRNRLRGDEGGTYAVATIMSYSRQSGGSYNFFVRFETARSRADQMIAAAIEEIEKIKLDDIDLNTYQKVISSKKELYKVNMVDNGFWIKYLADKYKYRESPEAILHYENILDKITIQDLRNTAFQYLNTEPDY